jgi:predicted metalloprotease with PDZ domain
VPCGAPLADVPAHADRALTLPVDGTAGLPPVTYLVDLSAREQHLVTVRMRVPVDSCPDGGRLVIATWTPGSYVVRDYVHHLQSIRASSEDGAPIALEPDGVSSWTLPAIGPDAGALIIELEWYAFDLSVRTNHVDDRHALLVGAATFPFLAGARERRHEVRFDGLRAQDRVTSLLPGEGAGPFVADDHLHLVDAAFEVGAHPSASRDVHGVEHRLVWAGLGEVDLESLVDDLARLATAAVALFDGELPVPRYTVIAVDGEGGGLEHRDGCVVAFPANAVADPVRRHRIIGLLAHEHLHLWNVRRLAPEALLDPDLDGPVLTTSLWIAEGWTSYYDRMLPVRAGLRAVPGMLEDLTTLHRAVANAPGVALQSLHDASRTAWTKHYRRDENSLNAGTDYYAHGALAALELDLRLRLLEPDGDGLDAVLRALWRRFGTSEGRPTHGYTEEDVLDALREAGGEPLAARCVELTTVPGAPQLDATTLGAIGLRLEREVEGAPELGVVLGPDPGRVVLRTVLRGGPAWLAGVSGGDTLLAVDDEAVRPSELETLLRRRGVGAKVRLTLERGPRMLQPEVVLGPPRLHHRLAADPAARPAARGAFARWCGQPFPAT